MSALCDLGGAIWRFSYILVSNITKDKQDAR